MNKLVLLPILPLFLATGCAVAENSSQNSEQSYGFTTQYSGKAKIQNGIYHGQVGNLLEAASFSIAVPQASDPSQFASMKMKEEIGTDNIYVSFGPTDLDPSIYRVTVNAKRVPVTFTQMKTNLFPQIAPFIERAYGQPMQAIHQEDITFQGHPAVFAVYTQDIPGSSQLLGTRPIQGATLTHTIYYIDYDKYIVTLWVMGSSGGGINTVNDQNRSQLIHRTWPSQIKFVNSFHLK